MNRQLTEVLFDLCLSYFHTTSGSCGNKLHFFGLSHRIRLLILHMKVLSGNHFGVTYSNLKAKTL